MKKTFVIQVEYPDNDVIPSEEIMEVTQERIENHLERYFGANIMDGDYDRIKVKEVTDGFTLVKRMRAAQEAFQNAISSEDIDQMDLWQIRRLDLERTVDEYLKKMEE
jgi:aryl-alcohol dehydrogenase-like predicted oxidoreductase